MHLGIKIVHANYSDLTQGIANSSIRYKKEICWFFTETIKLSPKIKQVIIEKLKRMCFFHNKIWAVMAIVKILRWMLFIGTI